MSLKNQINILILIILTLGISMVFFLIYPVYVQIKDNAQEIIIQKQELASLDKKISNIKDFKNNYGETENNLKRAGSLFIYPEAPVDFILFLEKSSQKSGVQIEIIPSAPKTEKEYIWNSTDFQITSVGSFPNFLKFLEKIESSPYLIEITKLKVEKLTETHLKSEELKSFSLNDIKAIISTKVFSN